jgi:hypothetical protein
MFRKFFDPQAGETSGGPKYEFLGPITLDEIHQPIPTPEATEEVVETPSEAAPAAVEEKVETPTTQPEVTVETPATPDWKEYVKNPEYRKEVHSLLEIDEDAVALSKQLAQDEFVKKLVAYRQQNGNLTPFIEAATTDWDKVPQDRLILDDLKKQYSQLSSDKAEKLARSDYNQRFAYKEDRNLSYEENAEMAELTALKLEHEVEKIRSTRKAEQQQFLDSVKPVDFNAAVEAKLKETMEGNQKEFEEFKQSVETSPVLSKLYAEKRLSFGDKENSFNYTVNPDTIKEQTLDTSKFYGLFWDDGKFNFSKWAKVVAYANDTDGIDNAKINHGRSLGTKQVVENELENVKKETDKTPALGVKKSFGRAVMEDSTPLSIEEMFPTNGIR